MTRLISVMILLAFTVPSSGDEVRALNPAAASTTPYVNTEAQNKRYLKDTLEGLEAMRGESGFVSDKISLQKVDGKTVVKVVNSLTSPTNIALDMLAQIGAAQYPDYEKRSMANLSKMMNKLANVPYHKDTGLFYSWYKTDKQASPTNLSLSSIDNLHLALALYTLKTTYPDTPMAIQAEKILARMNLSAFYDPKAGLVQGFLEYKNPGWKMAKYHFSDLGSEARDLYGVGYALGLFRDVKDPAFLEKAVGNISINFADTSQGRILKTWDGGAFQLLLPDLLVDEKKYSSTLEESAKNYSAYVLSQQQIKRTIVPLAFSAGEQFVGNKPDYIGFAGHKILSNPINNKLKDPRAKDGEENAVTLHAVILAGTKNPEGFAARLETAEKYKDKENSLYQTGFGWMDAVQVDGRNEGKIVPAQLSLDQGMIALSLMKNLDKNGATPSSKALASDSQVKKRLTHFYNLIDNKDAAALAAAEGD